MAKTQHRFTMPIWLLKKLLVNILYKKIYTFVFSSPVSLCLQTKQPSFLTTGYTGKYRPVVQDLYANENAAIAVQTLS